MTRQEASEIIEHYRMCLSGNCPTLICANCEYNHDPRKVEEAFLTAIDALESAQPEPCEDCVSREAVSEWLKQYGQDVLHGKYKFSLMYIWKNLMELPPAQPEQRCVNCGRTVNNGGWYEDGRTRCPIEEHYALPKDGYCHLWEKNKVWEDDYVKRSEEGESDG